jgi:hypothetical protein
MEAQLSDELLHMIFKDLPQQTLRDTRVVNPQWNAVSTPLVFERIHTSLLSWSLAKLSALSQSPLARHVKAIDFHTEQLGDLGHRTFEQCRKDTNLPFLFGYDRLTPKEVELLESVEEPTPDRYTPSQIRKGWEVFRNCLDEQDPRLDLLEYGPLLKDYLYKFRNLREVVADRVKHSGTSRIDARVYWKNLERTILVHPFSRIGRDISETRWTNLDYYAWRDDGLAPTSFLLEALAHRSGFAGNDLLKSLTIEIPTFAHLYFIKHPELCFRREAIGPTDMVEKNARY